MSWLDYLVLLVYLASISAIGLYFRKGQKTGLSYFLGDRSIHWIPPNHDDGSQHQHDHVRGARPSVKSDWTFLQLYGPAVSVLDCQRVVSSVYTRYNVVTAYEFGISLRRIRAADFVFSSSSDFDRSGDLCPRHHARFFR
jgi:hypothetical protein